MTETVMQVFQRFILPCLVPLVVGAVGALVTSVFAVKALDVRVSTLEAIPVEVRNMKDRLQLLEPQIVRQEKALERDFLRHEQTMLSLTVKTDDQEKRLTRLETLVGETQALLAEIRADVKLLLRGGKH